MVLEKQKKSQGLSRCGKKLREGSSGLVWWECHAMDPTKQRVLAQRWAVEASPFSPLAQARQQAQQKAWAWEQQAQEQRIGASASLPFFSLSFFPRSIFR